MSLSIRNVAYRIRSWLFRLGEAETGPIRITQRRVFVLPTQAGFALAGALLIMLLGSINYALSLGFMLTFLLAGIGVLSIFHAFRTLVQLTVIPGRVEPVFVGEQARFGLILQNERYHVRPAIRARASTNAWSEVSLAPQSSSTLWLEVPATKRGILQPGRVTLETRFPLGLVRAWSYVIPKQATIVYPAPEERGPPPGQTNLSGHGNQTRIAGDDDFAGLRAHQLADSPRHVAWKAVARGGPMLTKQFSSHSSTELWLDWDNTPAELNIEKRLARLTRWVLETAAANCRYGLALPDKTIPPNEGEPHFHACLQALALYGQQD